MWVALLGAGPEVARLAGVTVQDHPVTREPGFMDLLVRARVAMVIVNTALLVAIVALAWRLLGFGPALLGGLVLALDPFLVAHGQVVHVDGLSAGFMTVAMLAAGVYWWAGGRPAYLALCAVASGLAVLTKAPSLVLGLLVPVVALSAPLVDRGAWPWRRVLGSLVVVGALGLAVVVLLWPAFWVAPLDTVKRAVTFTLATSAEHRPGNFFLGQPVADPGPWYYPVAIVFRLSPLALAGLVALGVLLPSRPLVRPTLLLLLFVCGFILFLSLAGKKLDRYTLPAFPSLDLLAGLGLWTLGAWIVPYLTERGISVQARRSFMALGVVMLAIGQAVPLAMVAPYALSYYNPIVGGGPAAARVLLVGWGEGLDQVAAHLNAQPGADRQMISVYFPLELNFQGMVAGTVTQFGDVRPVDYVVDYVNAAQRGQTPSEVVGLAPEQEVWINGILYARVFRFDPPRRVR
jgi:4-amino-4-deoxy-L-arabinose transferase-like glycosyltransferase